MKEQTAVERIIQEIPQTSREKMFWRVSFFGGSSGWVFIAVVLGYREGFLSLDGLLLGIGVLAPLMVIGVVCNVLANRMHKIQYQRFMYLKDDSP